MSLALSSPGLYPHILKVGEVAIFKSSPIGSHSVLIRKTFINPDGLIDIEFETGYILQVESGLLFWEEYWIENPGTKQSETGSSEVVARKKERGIDCRNQDNPANIELFASRISIIFHTTDHNLNC